jgi:hypothetical protein
MFPSFAGNGHPAIDLKVGESYPAVIKGATENFARLHHPETLIP